MIVWLGFFIFTGRSYGVKDVQFTTAVFREQEKTLPGNILQQIDQTGKVVNETALSDQPLSVKKKIDPKDVLFLRIK